MARDAVRDVQIAAYSVVDFSPMDGAFGRCRDSQPNFVATDIHYRDGDVIADHQAFISAP
jgi:hypothetical protein